MTILYPHSDLTTKCERLAGDELLAYVNSNQLMSRVDLCQGAGYERNFTAFYEAILDARQAINGEYKVVTNGDYYEMNGRDWYEDMLTDSERELYDMIEDMCPEFSKLDASECQQFMDELEDIGITTAVDFECAYMYQTDAYNAEAEYAQYLAEEIMCINVHDEAGMVPWLVIDWQACWDCNLKYDHSVIEFDGVTYFFQDI